ncbi:MAG: DUF418 domain-containing protein [Candidatus Bacteroides intestinipullorum]|uniref:DUF418 domain-containing protein n=1 Tax=Candidatus Bacteroides intestinipullorum TaxID=2838471 RepID=A0A9E2KF84_9BACE|nr:DUF418 domain-containing protein [Candidatus Bacteroides intestinipullorum]
MVNTNDISPVKTSERFIILDALRGFALLGICMANFPEFSLYTFLSPEAAASMSTAVQDKITRYLLYIFVDGKFYTLFSLLFGIGFSIIIRNAERKGVNGFRIFYRRMGMLMLFGLLHLMFIWSGDILLLYALLGMLLPLFRQMPDKKLLGWALFFLILSIGVDLVCEITRTNLALPFIRLQETYCAEYGINGTNFAYWLHDAEDYGTVFQFLVQGACVRMQEFIIGNRYFKVLGLFLVGFYIGRNRIYADLEGRKNLLVKVCRLGLIIGLPCSLLYAWSSMGGHPLSDTLHSLFYFISVYPLGFAYAAGLCLLYLRVKSLSIWKWLAAPGRMALTNYIGQSVIGMFLFYGIGLGWGSTIGLLQTEVIVLAVFLFQMLFSRLLLSEFKFGPLEWIWRMLTYGKWLAIR